MPEIELHPDQLSKEIRKIAEQSKTEEDFKIRVMVLFNNLKGQLGIESEAEYEKMIYRARRADAVYPAIVLEFKKPGRLRSQATTKEAIDELSDYLTGMAKGKNVPRKYVGIAIDGESILFIRPKGAIRKKNLTKTNQLTLTGEVIEELTDWEINGPVPVSEASMEKLILFFRGLAFKNLNPDNLANDFGSKSDIGRGAIKILYGKLQQTKSPKTKILFDEWKRLFGIVYGEELSKAKKDLKFIISEYELQGEVGLQEILFTLHTYFAFLMKLIAAEILSLRAGSLISSLAKEISTINGEQLKQKLSDLEDGGLFKRLGIKNYMEGDFFSWYINEWDEETAQLIRHIAQKLSVYEPISTVLEPEEARDLLKKLYQYLIPKSIRHDLGEYYTPDWLAELVLREIDYDGNPNKRILDPACGSGTFLVLILGKILARLRDYPEEFDKNQVMKAILSNVVGFDINPIAVLAARTNFIIAISDLKKSSGITEIEIPIYLADSVLVPRKQITATGEEVYTVSTSGGIFHIPAIFAKKEILEKVLEVLEDTIEVKADFETFERRLKIELPQNSFFNETVRLKPIFTLIKKLDKEDRDKIWTRIIKNNFAPVDVAKFDFIAGNPPWVNWQNLSSEYRKATEHLWWEYGLFQHRGFAARLGGSKVDFSMLFTYAAMDYYLVEKGRLGFVITQTLFKTKGVGGEHFRRFNLTMRNNNEIKPIKVNNVHDLVSVKPFKGVANRTAVLILTKSEKTEYPIKYFVWNKKNSASIPMDATYESVLKRLRKVEKQANPIDPQSILSPWLTCFKEAWTPLNKMLGKSHYKAHEGVNTLGANGIYWLNVLEKRADGKLLVENICEAGDNNVMKVQKLIEPDFVYNLLRGKEICQWKIKSEHSILMMHDPKERKGYNEKNISVEYPKTYAFLKTFENELINRPIFKKFFCVKNKSKRKETFNLKAPFYSMYGVGDYTFSPYKVVWKEQSTILICAVVDETITPRIMPDHKLMFVSFQDKNSAYYCCALLASTPCRTAIKSYVINTSTSTHILDYISIPKFDQQNPLHDKIANLGIEATRLAYENKSAELLQIEEEIDAYSCEIWNISKTELDILKEELNS